MLLILEDFSIVRVFLDIDRDRFHGDKVRKGIDYGVQGGHTEGNIAYSSRRTLLGPGSTSFSTGHRERILVKNAMFLFEGRVGGLDENFERCAVSIAGLPEHEVEANGKEFSAVHKMQ